MKSLLILVDLTKGNKITMITPTTAKSIQLICLNPSNDLIENLSDEQLNLFNMSCESVNYSVEQVIISHDDTYYYGIKNGFPQDKYIITADLIFSTELLSIVETLSLNRFNYALKFYSSLNDLSTIHEVTLPSTELIKYEIRHSHNHDYILIRLTLVSYKDK